MSERKVVKPVALAVGAALASAFAFGGVANAESIDNPFEMSTLTAGYMLGEGEGSCGGDKEDKGGEGSCGEGSCGGDKEDGSHDKDGEGSCGESKDGEGSCGESKDGEGSCGESKDGEGSCGEDKGGEGSCGEDKKDAEGSCGEGSCGGVV